ncbi:MAG: DUF6484 domain-containing protein [Pseudomonadota bacterium]
MAVKDRIDGIVIGILIGVDTGRPSVRIPAILEDQPIRARTLVAFREDDLGCEVALQFEGGDLDRPLILGRIQQPGDTDGPEVLRDGQRVRVHAQERLELRCGKASIILEADGHVTIRGTHLVNHASASNRIRGGSVNIN